jgi:hypothetical protein
VWTGSSALPDDSALVGRFPFALRRAAPFELAAFVLAAARDCVDARQQDPEHFGCQFDVVQCLDQLIGSELSLLPSRCERGVEVDLRHPRRERKILHRQQCRAGGTVINSLVDDRRRLVVHWHHPSSLILLSAPVP